MSAHHVVSVVVEGMSPLEPAVAEEVFGWSWPDLDVEWYRYTVCAEEPGPVRLQGGLLIEATADLSAVARADTVIIPGWCGVDHAPSPALLDALRAAHRRGARLASFCTGAFVLGAAGVLDDVAATTHWNRSREFAARFPAVRLDPDVLYVDNGQVLTSAGSAASVDLALHLVRSDHGAVVANHVARHLVVAPHRDGGQAQFIETPVPAGGPAADPVAATMDWALSQLAEDLSVEVLAGHAMMSPRTFTRRFRSTTGTSPHQWVLAQRLQMARRLLETTDESVDAVAARSGFGTAAAMRLQFNRRLRTTPQAYRRCFVEAG